MKARNNILVAVAAVGLIVALSPRPARAEEVRGLTVSPLVFELNAKRGDVLRGAIKVDNITESALVLVAQRRNFTAYGEDGQPELTDRSTPYSLASWLSVTPSEARIPSKGANQFNFTINVPLDAEPGSHLGSVTFKTRPDSTGGGQVAVVQEVGALILLKVPGEVTESADIESFKTSGGSWQEYGPVGFELRLRNKGNVHFKPVSSNIVVKNIFGQKVADLKFDPKNVLPDSIRKFQTSWNRKWLFSRYSAEVTVVYGDDNQVLTRQIHFYGLPYKIITTIILIFLIIGSILYLGRKRLKRTFRVLFGRE